MLSRVSKQSLNILVDGVADGAGDSERTNGKRSQRQAATAPIRRQKPVVHPGREMPWSKLAEFMAGESECGWPRVKGLNYAVSSSDG